MITSFSSPTGRQGGGSLVMIVIVMIVIKDLKKYFSIHIIIIF